MVDIGKFTQIRPATTLPLPIVGSRHIRLIEGETGHDFIDSISLTFVERQAGARRHLEAGGFAERVTSVANFLLGESSVISAAGLGAATVPAASLCTTAAVLTWLDPAAPITAGKLDGAILAAGLSGDIDFPAVWRADLIALFILPGLYSDHRRYLAMLLRLCVLVSRASGTGPSPQDLRDQTVDGCPVPGSLLDQMLTARLLFPSWSVARKSAKPASPTLDLSGITQAVGGHLLSGHEGVQLLENLSAKGLTPAKTNLGGLPKQLASNAGLVAAAELATSVRANSPSSATAAGIEPGIRKSGPIQGGGVSG